MNKKAEIAKEALIVLIVVVFTSALIFGLLNLGLIEVNSEPGTETSSGLLNSEFIPYGRSGDLIITNFKFCQGAEQSACEVDSSYFFQDNEVRFSFDIVTSPFNNELTLVQNYRLIGPSGNILLEADSLEDFYLEFESEEELETIQFVDYFIIEEDDPKGEYTLELIVENPTLNKEVTASYSFTILGDLGKSGGF